MGDLKEIIALKEERFSRFERIEWWDQQRIGEAKILIIGAGALGNEVIKNLALLGFSKVVIVDMDHIEASNLSRSVLFRISDAGQPKAACAARSMQEIYPEAKPLAKVVDVRCGLGLGYFRWADVIIGATDNREARIFINSVCAKIGRPWIDGGIELLQGIARVFHPPQTACYECTMSKRDWEIVTQRRSCSLFARRALQHRGVPTTPTAASIIGGIQAQETLKLVHDMQALNGEGCLFDGVSFDTYKVTYPINPECEWHEAVLQVESAADFTSETSLKEISWFLEQKLGGLDALELNQEIVSRVKCPACGHNDEVWLPEDLIPLAQTTCPACNTELIPDYLPSLAPDHQLLHRSPKSMGIPAWDIIWGRHKDHFLGVELSGDAPFT